MPKKYYKTLSLGLSGLIALGIINLAEAAPQQILHEMVPHVVLPETVQYNKTVKNQPDSGYTSVNSPCVATYIAAPSYQLPHGAEFRSVGQSVYPVTPEQLPEPAGKDAPLPENVLKTEPTAESSGEISKTEFVGEPVRLASASEDIVPTLPAPPQTISQTGIFCQHPADPPSAWAFSSPLFKAASVPAGWGGNQTASISHNGIKNSQQQISFQQAGVPADPAAQGGAAQGIPYSTFQVGRNTQQNQGPVTHVLPNGMVLLTMPADHNNCGLIRCRANHQPRTLLLPPGNTFGMPNVPGNLPGMPYPNGTANPGTGASMQPGFGMPMMQTVPITAMTPMGPAVLGYRQIPMMPSAMPQMMQNPLMNPMMNQFVNPMQPFPGQLPGQQVPMTAQSGQIVPPFPAFTAEKTANNAAVPASAIVPASATETSEEAKNDEQPQQTNQMVLVATPFGYYAVQAQSDVNTQLAQMQAAQMQQTTQMQPQLMTQMNPYMGVNAAPFGYVALNSSGMYPQTQYSAFGMPMMNSMGMVSMADMLQMMMLMQDNKGHRRGRLFERLAERREKHRASSANDPFAQLMQAWSTPYVSPDTTLRMPARNAYPYGYFGVQSVPQDTANYGGYHNLYFGSTSYPGLY